MPYLHLNIRDNVFRRLTLTRAMTDPIAPLEMNITQYTNFLIALMEININPCTGRPDCTNGY